MAEVEVLFGMYGEGAGAQSSSSFHSHSRPLSASSETSKDAGCGTNNRSSTTSGVPLEPSASAVIKPQRRESDTSAAVSEGLPGLRERDVEGDSPCAEPVLALKQLLLPPPGTAPTSAFLSPTAPQPPSRPNRHAALGSALLRSSTAPPAASDKGDPQRVVPPSLVHSDTAPLRRIHAALEPVPSCLVVATRACRALVTYIQWHRRWADHVAGNDNSTTSPQHSDALSDHPSKSPAQHLPSFLRRLDALWVLGSVVWAAVAALEKAHMFPQTLPALHLLLSTRATPHRSVHLIIFLPWFGDGGVRLSVNVWACLWWSRSALCCLWCCALTTLLTVHVGAWVRR